jgi:hypothetical protein
MGRLLDPNLRRSMRQACLNLRPRLAYGHHLDQLQRTYQSIRSISE